MQATNLPENAAEATRKNYIGLGLIVFAFAMPFIASMAGYRIAADVGYDIGKSKRYRCQPRAGIAIEKVGRCAWSPRNKYEYDAA